VIRLARLDDAASVSALIRATYSLYVPRLGRDPQPMTDDYAALIEAGEVWVSDGKTALEGVLVVQKTEDYLLIRTIGIAPARQRQGLGTRLMGEAERLAVAADIRTLRLYTNEVMTGNVELYERLGYIETHRTGPEGKQVIYMTKELK
jgi:ribosomal protein S18 acetylase RimI-like enzyme